MSAAEQALVTLVDALCAEQRRLWPTDGRRLAEALLAPHPKVLAVPRYALLLVYGEVLLRQGAGEAPGLAEYVRRFPQYADELPPLFEVHEALESGELSEDLRGADTIAELPAIGTGSGSWPAVPGYEILGELGRGGMGIVYRARHTGLDRVVALKMILAGFATDPVPLARFRAEARAVAQFRHPNIIPVHDVGELAGRPYFAMEYVAGGSLAERLDGPVPARPAADLIGTLARAVHAAHLMGIIHRDLKPANILLQPEAGAALLLQPRSFTAKIADFGLAMRPVDGSGTLRGVIVGTPSYMAPEQAAGAGHAVGGAADVYALGAILYELLSGRPPFKSPSPQETLRQVLTDDPVPLAHFPLRIPRDLNAICLKCLQKDPAGRYPSALSLAEDLARYLADRPILARPAGAGERAWRWARRNPIVAGLTALAVGLLLVLAVGGPTAAVVMGTRLRRAEQAERGGQEKLWAALLEKARATRLSRRPGQRFDGLQAVTEAVALARTLELGDPAVDQLRTAAIGCLALADIRIVHDRAGGPPGWLNVTFDGNLETYARRDRDGAIVVGRVADDLEVRRIPGSGPGHELFVLRLSPDGQYLAATFAPGHVLKVWRLAEPAVLFTGPADVPVSHVDFRPDSRQLAVAGNDGALLLIDLPSGEHRRLPAAGAAAAEIAYHPDGRLVAVATRVAGKPAVQIRDVESGAVLRDLMLPQPANGIAWHPAGDALAAGCSDRHIYLWEYPSGKQIDVLTGPYQGGGINIAYHPAGELMASCGWEGMLRLWNPYSGQALFSTPGVMYDLRFGRTGTRLAAHRSGDHVHLFEVADGGEYRTLSGGLKSNRQAYHDAAFAADGQVLAVAMSDGTRLWNVVTGRELAFLPTGLTAGVVFLPSGTLLTAGHTTGVRAWPIRTDPAIPGQSRVGPPTRLLDERTERLARSRDGRTVAVTSAWQGARILDPDRPAAPGRLLPHQHAAFIDHSPDGRWVATGTHNGTGIKVWDAHARRLERDLPVEGGATARFSPDDRWLATTTMRECQLWHVGSWEPGPRIDTDGRQVAFAPDGTLLAIPTGPGVVALVDPESGRRLATLESSDQDRNAWIGFSPDGTRLATTNNDSASIHVWDLRRVRDQLVPLGLDWDRPAYPPSPAAVAAIRLQVLAK